jgi:hypothetical protein
MKASTSKVNTTRNALLLDSPTGLRHQLLESLHSIIAAASLAFQNASMHLHSSPRTYLLNLNEKK